MTGSTCATDAGVVLITGISGSGKSVALHALEDAGYYCVDNLPPELVPELLAVTRRDRRDRVAVAVDVRSVANPQALSRLLSVRQLDASAVVLFLDAATQTLVQRFSETRRRHPLSQQPQGADDPGHHALVEAIALERELLEPVRALAQCIDTSHSTPSQLRAWVRQAVHAHGGGLSLVFESFGFKRGVPLDADFVFDARMLPNPFYDPAMRTLTGLDQAVGDYLLRHPQAAQLVDDIQAFLSRWLPAFEAEQRSYLTVAVGCTGGQHRSVYIVEQLALHFQKHADVIVRHRELQASRALAKTPS
ncbi:MAG: RNase adapter RapZ [Betaproteobacteria bacterium]|nr:RNase adapter RapZ [Betaproteobacteria bacterium]